MQLLEVSGAVRHIYGSLGVKRLMLLWAALCYVTGNVVRSNIFQVQIELNYYRNYFVAKIAYFTHCWYSNHKPHNAIQSFCWNYA